MPRALMRKNFRYIQSAKNGWIRTMARRMASRMVELVTIFPNRVVQGGGGVVTYPVSVPGPNEHSAASVHLSRGVMGKKDWVPA